VTLTPQVQTLVDQIVQQLGLQGVRPSSLEINLDRDGIVQDVKPKLTFRRAKVSPLEVADDIDLSTSRFRHVLDKCGK